MCELFAAVYNNLMTVSYLGEIQKSLYWLRVVLVEAVGQCWRSRGLGGVCNSVVPSVFAGQP